MAAKAVARAAAAMVAVRAVARVVATVVEAEVVVMEEAGLEAEHSQSCG